MEGRVLFRGEDFTLLPSGALHWPRRSALLVADLHLGKFAAFARSGWMLPPYDTAMTLSRLGADIEATRVSEVYSLGDAFHRDDARAIMSDADTEALEMLCASVAWTWVAGNHDPSRQAFAGRTVAAIDVEGLRLVHDVTGGPEGAVGGHLHPGAKVAMNGRSTRARCLVHDGMRMVLPAYGSSTGCLDVHHQAIRSALDMASAEVTMLGRDRVYRVPLSRLVR